jgi:membrane-bound serine protease (ClpP class)
MRVRFLTALAVSVPLGLITAFLMTIAVRARRNKIVTGAEGLVGEIGIAQTTLAPAGKVVVHGEFWDAVSAIPIPAGERVVVRQIDGLTLRVDPASAARTVLA